MWIALSATPSMYRRLVTAVLLVTIWCTTQSAEPAASKSKWRITEGKGYTACEAFLKNLNAFPPNEPPMVCELKIHPKHTTFSRPQWEELDVETNLQLIYAAESLLVFITTTGTRPKPFEEWQKKFRERVAASTTNPPRLRRAMVDLNGSGRETLIWYEWPGAESCQKTMEMKLASGMNSFGGHIFVQSKTSGELQTFSGLTATQSRTELLLSHAQAYFITGSAGREVFENGTPTRAEMVMHRVAPRLTEDGKYIVYDFCVVKMDL